MTGSAFILNIAIPLTESNVSEMRKAEIDTDDLKSIIKYGFFGFTQGSMTFHRDKSGKLRKIEKEIVHSKNNNERKIEKHIYYIV